MIGWNGWLDSEMICLTRFTVIIICHMMVFGTSFIHAPLRWYYPDFGKAWSAFSRGTNMATIKKQHKQHHHLALCVFAAILRSNICWAKKPSKSWKMNIVNNMMQYTLNIWYSLTFGKSHRYSIMLFYICICLHRTSVETYIYIIFISYTLKLLSLCQVVNITFVLSPWQASFTSHRRNTNKNTAIFDASRFDHLNSRTAEMAWTCIKGSW